MKNRPGDFIGFAVALAALALNLNALPCANAASFVSIGPMNSARYNHTATLLQNGMVLVAGGIGNGGYLSSAELYNPATGKWTLTGPLHTARALHTATLLPNGRVLVAGGSINTFGFLSSAELYDPASGA
jgi:hypothetical protein